MIWELLTKPLMQWSMVDVLMFGGLWAVGIFLYHFVMGGVRAWRKTRNE